MPQTTVLAMPGWRLEFLRCRQCWSHALHRLTPAGPVELMRSSEGGENEIWPASPPFQELHVHRTAPPLQAALLVGRAGRSHWSASIELDHAADAIRFDVACRIHARPHRLGSCYSLHAAWLLNGNELLFEGVARLQARFIEVEDSGNDGRIALRPAMSELAPPYPKTVRWQYRLDALHAAPPRLA
jgi:hypothetical protein